MPPENADAFARLTAVSKVPIATGENLFTRQTFRPFIEKQACDIIQPDVLIVGGGYVRKERVSASRGESQPTAGRAAGGRRGFDPRG